MLQAIRRYILREFRQVMLYWEIFLMGNGDTLPMGKLKVLNNLVSGYFDFAEIQAMRKNPMYMKDYIEHLDAILTSTGEKLLLDAGKISNKQALEKLVVSFGTPIVEPDLIFSKFFVFPLYKPKNS